MSLTEEDALRAYAKTINILNIEPLESILATDFHYSSQSVFSELTSQDAFLDYLRPKLQTIANSRRPVFAEMGTMPEYFGSQPCVVLAQVSKDNLVGLVVAKIEGNQLKRLDLCIVPPADCATRTGEYPR